MKKYIVREVAPEHTDFSFYFDNDGLREIGGDYCNNLFIVPTRHNYGFNGDEYKRVQKELDDLLDQAWDIGGAYEDAYPSVGALLLDYDLIKSIKQTHLIKRYKDFLLGDGPGSEEPETVAEFLTLKTGKKWAAASARGYCQGDYVEGVYCEKCYKNGIQNYLEVWLGCAKEFCVIYLDEDGKEVDRTCGYIVADSEARDAKDYKRLVCEWAELEEEDTELQMIIGQSVHTIYSYETA